MARMIRKNRKFMHHDLNNVYIPAVLTALSMVLLALVLNYVNFDILYGTGSSAIVFASFAGSAFLLFMAPKSRTANVKRFLRGYLIGAVFGTVGFYLIPELGLYLVAALMVLITSILMVKTDSMHPPALSLMFAYIIYSIGVMGNVVVVAGVVVLLVVKLFLEKAVFIAERDIESMSGKSG